MTHRGAFSAGGSVVGLLILLVAGWFVLGGLNATTISVLILALYFAVGGYSFSFLHSTLGVFSLAQPVFLAVGGYTGIYLSLRYGVSPWLSLLIAPAVAAVVALPIALAMVRAGTGPILGALVTLIVAEAVPALLISVKPLGGAVGLYAQVRQNPDFWQMQWVSGVPFARLLLILNVLTIAFMLWWRQSRFGHYNSAIKDAPNAAAAVGIPTSRLRIASFLIAAMIAAPAGVVYAQYNLLTSADLFLGSTVLFQIVVVALAGGAARAWGPLVGSLAVVYISQEASDMANGRSGIGPLTFAAIFALMAFLMPTGISGTWEKLVNWATVRRAGHREGAGDSDDPVRKTHHVSAEELSDSAG